MRTRKEINRAWRGEASAYPASAWVSLFLALFSTPFIILGILGLAGSLGTLKLGPLSQVAPPAWALAIFGLAFLVGGVALLGLAVWQTRLRLKHAATPYQADYPWSPSGIGDDTVNTAWQSAWKALALGGFLTPVNVAVFFLIPPGEIVGRILVFVIVGFFDLILLGLIGQAFYWARQRLRFGKTRVQFSRFPYHPGETLSVTFEGGPKLVYTGLSVELQCIEEEVPPQMENLRCYQIYLDQQKCGTDFAGRANLSFAIPPDLPGTQLHRSTPTYWELAIEAEAVQYRGIFLVPIYTKVR